MKQIIPATLFAALLTSCAGPSSYYADPYYQPQGYSYGGYYPRNNGYGADYRDTSETDESSDSGLAGVVVPLAIGAALLWGMGGSGDSSPSDSGPNVEALVKENGNAAAAGRPLPNPGYGTH